MSGTAPLYFSAESLHLFKSFLSSFSSLSLRHWDFLCSKCNQSKINLFIVFFSLQCLLPIQRTNNGPLLYKLISFPPLVLDVQLHIGPSMDRAERPELGVENWFTCKSGPLLVLWVGSQRHKLKNNKKVNL